MARTISLLSHLKTGRCSLARTLESSCFMASSRDVSGEPGELSVCCNQATSSLREQGLANYNPPAKSGHCLVLFVCLFVYCLWAKNGFYISSVVDKSKEYYFVTWKLYEVQILMFINKVILKHSCAHPFMYCLGPVLCVTAELSTWSRDMANSAQVFAIWPCIVKMCKPAYPCLWMPVSS